MLCCVGKKKRFWHDKGNLFGGDMRKSWVFLAVLLGLCGALVSSYADEMQTEQNCAFSSEEQRFAAQLSDENKEIFCNMTDEQREKCMQFAKKVDAYGNRMTPNQAVRNVIMLQGCRGEA